jgi:hypothetical protein
VIAQQSNSRVAPQWRRHPPRARPRSNYRAGRGWARPPAA